MYSRKSLRWIFLYYSGEKLEIVAADIGLCKGAVTSRIKYMKMPTRPKGTFTLKVKEQWLKEKHIAALRRLFEKE